MQLTKTFHAADRASWRAWLEQHHADEKEVWLVYTKAHTGQPSVSYEDSVEEALCFGWVDSLIQKIDLDRYARKFTPRRDGSAWSDTNKRRVAKVIAEGRMTPSGLAKINYPLDSPVPDTARNEIVLPGWIAAGLQTSPQAWQNFSKLPPSHQKRYVAWLSSGKKDETRQKNLGKAIAMLEQGLRLEINTRTGK
jgi:uncharacterized protein YdeI (YjbR/CyaY-like superfamily)